MPDFDNFDFSDMNFDFSDDSDKHDLTLSSRKIRDLCKNRFAQALQADALKKLVGGKLLPGECLHLIGVKTFDCFQIVYQIIDWTGPLDYFCGSSWCCNLHTTDSLASLIDNKMIKNANMLVGSYLKQRDPTTYFNLFDVLSSRGEKLRSTRLHSKLMIMSSPTTGDYYTVEGSANMTVNKNIENYAIFNDKAVFDFHKEWMELIFDDPDKDDLK